MTTPQNPHAILPVTVENQGINAGTPLLLLPVHIQTRFVDSAGDRKTSELWVRIYPDQIAVDSHEPDLSAQEVSDGQAYWNAVWEAGSILRRIRITQKAPWRTCLASLYTPQRAAWIALQLTPTNVSLQPVGATPAGSASVPAPVFPVVPSRNSSWEKPAVADALPDAWTVVLISSGQTSLYRGSPIVQPLNVSLTPNGTGFPPGSPVDAGLQWIGRFPNSGCGGDGAHHPVDGGAARGGLRSDFCIRVAHQRRESGANVGESSGRASLHGWYFVSSARLRRVTTIRRMPLPLIAARIPITRSASETEREAPLTGNPNCDGQEFASLTGIPSMTFDHVRYADGTGGLNSTDMLRALWPATMGYFLSQMMANVFTPTVIEQAREYAMANVHPRGPLASFRTGTTPYGVLPVTSLFNYSCEISWRWRSKPGLADFVRRLWPTWLSASSADAPAHAAWG